MGMITVTILLPVLGAVLLGLVRGLSPKQIQGIAFGASMATFIASLLLLGQFDRTNPNFQLAETMSWIPALNAQIAFAVDGISLVLILLTTFLTPLVLFASTTSVTDRFRGYAAAFLLLEAAVIAVFAATDLLLFAVVFEFTIVPMYFIIGIFGGVNRRYAAVKFFLYTLAGGLAMLVAIVYLYTKAGSFAYADMLQLELSLAEQRWLFFAFLAAFAVKIPIWPVHTWLPDAHTEAPTGGSVFLAGVLLKMGTFGLLRYMLPLFADAARLYAPWLIGFAVVGILYGAIVALMQSDVKRLVAYSSVSHMGFVVLGTFALNTTATSASVVQMVNHGLSTGALFLLIGFLYERRHTREIAAFGGLGASVPVLAGFWLVVSLSSLALPGLNGFVGEFPILIGTFASYPAAAVLASFGAVLAAVYLLWAYQRIFHGPLETDENRATPDMTRREIGILSPLVALIIAIGIYPSPLFDLVEPSVERVLIETGVGETMTLGGGGR